MNIPPLANIIELTTIAGIVSGGIAWTWSKGKRLYQKFDRAFTTQEEMRVQLFPNGGSSLADAVNITALTTKANHADILTIKENIERMHGRQRLIMDALDFGVLEFDELGHCIQVNKWLLTHLGLQESHFLGSAWLNLIHEDEFETQWNRAAESHGTIHRVIEIKSERVCYQVLFSSFRLHNFSYARITFELNEQERVTGSRQNVIRG